MIVYSLSATQTFNYSLFSRKGTPLVLNPSSQIFCFTFSRRQPCGPGGGDFHVFLFGLEEMMTDAGG